ncbi:hypothetical protein GF325_05935 [Candidatus Bathyarchaeota archaeon]|nr:hypothetical protein [Candidatus Bathyarchaeota archaeon]
MREAIEALVRLHGTSVNDRVKEATGMGRDEFKQHMEKRKLNKKLIVIYLYVGIKKVSISLHGDDPGTHEMIAGNGAGRHFNTIREAIKKASAFFHVQVKGVMHRKNLDAFPGIVDLAKNAGAREVQVQVLLKGGEAARLPNSVFLEGTGAMKAILVYSLFATNMSSHSFRKASSTCLPSFALVS